MASAGESRNINNVRRRSYQSGRLVPKERKGMMTGRHKDTSLEGDEQWEGITRYAMKAKGHREGL